MTINEQTQAQRIYEEWDAALSAGDAEKLLALYHSDAVLESPLASHLLKKTEGICRGIVEIRELLGILKPRQPSQRQFHRVRYFTDGKTLMWEYPRTTPSGEQMDFVEVMELEGGLIKYHRVYWGWYGVNILKDNLHWK